MTKSIILKNVRVFDPKNTIAGKVSDIFIKQGKICDSFQPEEHTEIIEETELVAMPGAIDLCSHYLSPEIDFSRGQSIRSQDIVAVPLLEKIEQSYLSHGYTLICEMDVPMTQSKMTLQNIKRTNILDTTMIMDFGSNWTFFSDIEAGNRNHNVSIMFQKLLEDLKGYAISINHPYHQQFWKLTDPVPNNPQKIPLFNINPIDAFKRFYSAYSLTNLRSSFFISPYDMENPVEEPNIISLLNELLNPEKMDENIVNKKNIHLSLANHYFTNNPDALVSLMKKNKNLEINVAPLIYGYNRPLITRDRNIAMVQSTRSKVPLTTIDLEFDTEYYITTRQLKEHNSEDLGIFVSGIFLILAAKKNDLLENIVLSTNGPYNMLPSDIPEIITLLVNNNYRNNRLQEMGVKSENLKEIQNFDFNLDLNDIVKLISLNPANSLGLSERKGHLGIGADADITLFQIDPSKIMENTENSAEYLKKAFSEAKYVIKNGNIIDPKIGLQNNKRSKIGRLLWTKGKPLDTDITKVVETKKSLYKKHFSLYYDSIVNSVNDDEEII